MLVGSAPSELKLGTTTVTGVRRGAGLIYDSDVAAFQKASGATQVGPILALVDYLKAQSLWDYARFYPMKSAQNAGSGSTVYGLGGLTSNNMTLINSPTWGSDGVTFDAASSQAGTISDFMNGGTVSLWWKGTNTAAGGSCVLSQYDYGANERSVGILKGTVAPLNVQIRRSSSGLAGADTEYFEGPAFSGDLQVLSVEWIDGGGRTLWVNKDPQIISYVTGGVQTERLNATCDISVMSLLNNGSPSDFASGVAVFVGFIETALTTTQRETITDLINDL
jgi:hypothetical protein